MDASGNPTQLYLMYDLADYLKQPLKVIMEMTVSEFDHWHTYLKLKHERLSKNGS